MTKPKIKPLDIHLTHPSEEIYNAARAKYIAEYTEYQPGGFFSSGGHIHRPDIATAKWDSRWPGGYDDWVRGRGSVLTSVGQQSVIDKINELVKAVNR